jgi:predicted MFS family arabinose efflux permease
MASLLSNVGGWAQQVAEPWLLLTLGASSFLIGLDSFAMNAPILLLTIAGGALADRSDRRRVITIFQSIQMLCPAALVILMWLGMVKPWMVIVLSVVVGVTDALSMPSFQSIVPSIVSHEQIASGVALNSTQFNLSRIVGPAVAGLLMSTIGAMGCFVVNTLSYFPFIGIALWILPRRTTATASRIGEAATNPFAGIRDIVQQPKLLGALFSVLITSVMCSPLMTFIPVLVRDVFHGGPGRFSATIAAFGAGGLLGGAAMLAVDPKADLRRLSWSFALANGFVLVFTGLSPSFWVLLPLAGAAGMAMTIGNTAANSLLQTTADSNLVGRTVSLYMLAMRGGIAIGALVTGLTVNLLGIQYTFVIDGLVAVLAQFAVARLWLRSPV